MKSKFLFAIFPILIVNILNGQELFDPYTVHTMNIMFHDAGYDAVLQNRWDDDDKTYLLADIVFNGDTIDSVGVRYKGNSTFYFARLYGIQKFPLNIDLNLVHEDQELLGYNKVKLSNSLFDATFVRETLGYTTESYYLPTPETGYINVYVNNELWGLYVAVESINGQFLNKHFGNNDGAFFKCEAQYHYGQIYPTKPDLRWWENDTTYWKYQKGYELKSEYGWTDLLELIYILNFDIENIETILNVNRVLWFFASSAVMPDLDSYIGWYYHNYYLYRNTFSEQFEIIPWDKDNTFGGVLINLITEADSSWIYHADPFSHEDNETRPLVRQLMSIPLYRKTYAAHMRTIIEDIYTVDYIQNLAYGIQDTIASYAENDTNQLWYLYNGLYFQENVDNYIVMDDNTHWCGITSTVNARLPYLLNHPEIMKTPPEILNVTQENTDPEPGVDVIIQAEVTGATDVELMVTANFFPSKFTSVQMYDDGVHGDGAAGDNIFAAVVPFQGNGAHIKYYIRAGNDDALILSPQKAEREFYEYIINTGEIIDSEVVINEINYNSSDDFNTSDWIELYNANSNSINISSWTFKDDNDVHQFILPENTILQEDEYIVLCRDTTSFKALFPDVINYIGNLEFGFRGSGELLRLYDADGFLVDTVNYADSLPWPTAADGEGASLELISPDLDNALASSWRVSDDHGTPGINNDSTAVKIPAKHFQKNKVKIYPNPASGILYCESNSQFKIEIYDNLGRRLLTSNKREIDISILDEGLYHIRIMDKKGNLLKTDKLIVVK